MRIKEVFELALASGFYSNLFTQGNTELPARLSISRHVYCSCRTNLASEHSSWISHMHGITFHETSPAWSPTPPTIHIIAKDALPPSAPLGVLPCSLPPPKCIWEHNLPFLSFHIQYFTFMKNVGTEHS